MSYCKSEGKDQIVFLTKEDAGPPPADDSLNQETNANQYFLPNGEINWDCPCHGKMIYGPCALEYREFLTNCVFPSEEATHEACAEKHQMFEKCVNKYPTVYPELQIDDRLNEAKKHDMKSLTSSDSKTSSSDDSKT